jgi:hypothetical protein
MHASATVKDVCDVQQRIGPQNLVREIKGHVVWIKEPRSEGESELASLLNGVRNFLTRYIVFPLAEQPIAIALWVVHTWLIEAFEYTPYLHVHSPEKQCGKTQLLQCLSLLSAEPWRAVSPSEAVLYRMIELKRPTLLLDEVDAVFKSGKNDRKEYIRALLNAGFERKAKVPRCVGQHFDIKEFNVFCPKAMAGIGKLPDTVSDRCIPIRIVRRSRDESVERFRRREAETDVAQITSELAQYAKDELNVETLRIARPQLPEELSDRHADICEPLLAIADSAGGSWPELSRKALVTLCSGEANEDDSLGVKLLLSIRDAFDESDTDRFSTKQLLEKLIAQETDSPWADWWESDLDRGNTKGPAAKFARLLKRHEIKARGLRLSDHSTTRGYLRADFEEAWKRFCPSRRFLDATMQQE